MALSTPRIRPFSPGHIPTRVLLLGLAGAVAVGGAYVAVAGNPLGRNQQPVAYQTSAVSQGTVQVTVSMAGTSSFRDVPSRCCRTAPVRSRPHT